MPIFYQQHINQNTQLAVWEIAEEESFFLEKIEAAAVIINKQRRLQHLAARYLLKILCPQLDINSIVSHPNQKPYFPNNEVYFSISHCTGYAAVIVSQQPVGIDIEIFSKKVERVIPKFLSATEQAFLTNNSSKLLTTLWCSKEALYKFYNTKGVDFKNVFQINFENLDIATNGVLEATINQKPVQVNYCLFKHFALCFVTK